MVHIDIKPLSVNEAWQGRRYKTPKYKQYQETLLWLLPKIKIPKPPYVNPILLLLLDKIQ